MPKSQTIESGLYEFSMGTSRRLLGGSTELSMQEIETFSVQLVNRVGAGDELSAAQKYHLIEFAGIDEPDQELLHSGHDEPFGLRILAGNFEFGKILDSQTQSASTNTSRVAFHVFLPGLEGEKILGSREFGYDDCALSQACEKFMGGTSFLGRSNVDPLSA